MDMAMQKSNDTNQLAVVAAPTFNAVQARHFCEGD